MNEITCIICPKGCKLRVSKSETGYIVEGNGCKRGIDYGINEMVNPVRVVTSTVKVLNGLNKRLPVITDKEIPKKLIFDTIKEINKVSVKAPIKINEIIIENVLNTGVNIVASRSMKEQ